MVLSQKRVGAVGDAHRDYSHRADHYHGDVDVGEHCHHCSAERKAQRAQDVDHFDTKVVVVQVFLQQGCRDGEQNINVSLFRRSETQTHHCPSSPFITSTC